MTIFLGCGFAAKYREGGGNFSVPLQWMLGLRRLKLDAIWQSNPLLRRYLGTPDNPELIIYRIRPERVRFMREWALTYHEVPC